MFLLVLLLILAADILFLKMLTHNKKDEKQYFYKVNKELKKILLKILHMKEQYILTVNSYQIF